MRRYKPQPVSPTMRVTRFSRTFSTIFSRRAATGRAENLEDEAAGNDDENADRDDDVGDDGVAIVGVTKSSLFLSLRSSMAITLPLRCLGFQSKLKYFKRKRINLFFIILINKQLKIKKATSLSFNSPSSLRNFCRYVRRYRSYVAQCT